MASMAQPQTSKRIFGVVAATIVLAAAIAGYYYLMFSGNASKDAFVDLHDGTASAHTAEIEKALEVDASTGLSKATVTIQTTRGKIKYKFYTNDAPKTVHRMVELIQSGFYNGLTFHRVIPGFVAQGGDPTGTGMGGSGVKLAAEFNSRHHVPGTVSMARAQDPNSADSQFYIMLGTHPHLDGQYTVFGQLIEGQDVADQLQVGDRMTSVTIEY
jgi:peptidylprolyl isomerase/peptidyl-prolyl cis-trans isomerase B (cyclophilin B)